MKSSRVCWRPGPSGFSRNKYTQISNRRDRTARRSSIRLESTRDGPGKTIECTMFTPCTGESCAGGDRTKRRRFKGAGLRLAPEEVLDLVGEARDLLDDLVQDL